MASLRGDRVAPALGSEHRMRRPICGHLVDDLDLEEVMQHLVPAHTAPAMN